MAYQEVTRLPNREIVAFWLLDGGDFQAYIEQRPGVTKVGETRAEVPHGHVATWPVFLHTAAHTVPDPAHPTAQWAPAYWLQQCDTFDTPSKNLEPGQMNTTGRRVMWREESADATQEEGDIDDVIVTRDGSNAVTDIKRKPH